MLQLTARGVLPLANQPATSSCRTSQAAALASCSLHATVPCPPSLPPRLWPPLRRDSPGGG